MHPKFFQNHLHWLILVLSLLSLISFSYYFHNDLTLVYNDARSHLNVSRRVVEGLKPGLAQIGSVWLPLTHILMLPTIWIDFMWHSGLAGSLLSMVAYVITGVYLYRILDQFQVQLIGRLAGVAIFALNPNILYMQSTPMTELVLIATMTLGCYYLLKWSQDHNLVSLIITAFWIMLSTLIRYDGWFLTLVVMGLVAGLSYKRKNYQTAEGSTLMFITLAGFGVVLWFLWNLAIFKDMFYFAFGPFSAYAQQKILSAAGELATKGNLWLSTQVFFSGLLYVCYTIPVIIAGYGLFRFIADSQLSKSLRLAAVCLISPLVFYIITMFSGHSAMFVQGLYGAGWFNIRYAITMIPTVAIFVGYAVDRFKFYRPLLLGVIFTIIFLSLFSKDNVTLEDGINGKSYSNITPITDWLKANTANKPWLILTSTSKNDPVMFSSGLPLKRFIYEGTGLYWDVATQVPEQWVGWIIMKVGDPTDPVSRVVSLTPGFSKYRLVVQSKEADIYELDPQYTYQLPINPSLY